MESFKLVAPEIRFAESYRAVVAEFIAGRENLVPFTLAFDHSDFSCFLAKLHDCSKGTGIPEGFAPHSTYWLVRSDGEVVGVSNLRHHLTESLTRLGGNIGCGIRPGQRRKGYGKVLLEQTLAIAWARGMSRVLMTCDKRNLASAQMILKNGGRLDSEEWLSDWGMLIQRYWIERPGGSSAFKEEKTEIE